MDFDDLTFFKDYRVKRISTHKLINKKHTDFISIPANKSVFLKKIKGPGCITNIWLTSTPLVKYKNNIPKFGSPKSYPIFYKFLKFHHMPHLLMSVFIRIYFDGNNKPSVNAPIGCFFGCGFGEYKQFMSKFMSMTAGGFTCNFWMPFKKEAKIEIYNSNASRGISKFYFSADYISYNSAGEVKNKGYFHAEYLKDKNTGLGKPYVVADIEGGKGHFLGMVLNTKTKNKLQSLLNLEGDMEVYVDGEKSPSLVSTGTEDEFGGGWYYLKNSESESSEFYSDYRGLTIKSFSKLGAVGNLLASRIFGAKLSQYRFYPETMPFSKSFKCLFHVGENDEIPSYYDSVAYWYQEVP